MNLVFLHGAPATGKYTVGLALAELTGYGLYHNHLVVDRVLGQHAFGTPGFVRLRDELWREYFTRAAREQPAGVIFTFNPESTVPQEFVDWIFQGLPARGVRICSVELTASEAAIESRLASSQRAQFKKLSDAGFYRRLRDSGAFASPVIPRTDLQIDTGAVAPVVAAALIRSHFGLG